MKTFKHRNTGELAYYKDGVFKQGRFCVEIGVEPSSEYWEEIISKDYEILSFINTDGEVYTKDKDNIYRNNCVDNFYNQFGDWRTEEHIFKVATKMKIHSVKRSSDGEVFSLGDVCFPTNTPQNSKPIDSIWLTPSGDLRLSSDNYTMYIEGLTKYVEPKVLFTTLDNVELKHGDKFYVVDTKFFKIFEAEAGITFKTEKWAKNSYFDKKLAEEWIVMNKPCLSINEMLDNVPSRGNIIGEYVIRLKEVAENKIKGNG